MSRTTDAGAAPADGAWADRADTAAAVSHPAVSAPNSRRVIDSVPGSRFLVLCSGSGLPPPTQASADLAVALRAKAGRVPIDNRRMTTTADLTERAKAVALVADQHAEFGDRE